MADTRQASLPLCNECGRPLAAGELVHCRDCRLRRKLSAEGPAPRDPDTIDMFDTRPPRD